jgi:PST family polysaccharide transporter
MNTCNGNQGGEVEGECAKARRAVSEGKRNFERQGEFLPTAGGAKRSRQVGDLDRRLGESIVAPMRQLTNVLARPGARQALANLGWLFVERVGRFALGTLVSLLVARYLGPERLGSLSYCLAIVTLLGFVPALGLDGVLKRELLKTPSRTAELLASTFLLRLLAGVIGFAGVVLAAQIGRGLKNEEPGLLIVLALLLFQPALFLPELWLQANLRAKGIAAVQIGTLAVSSGVRLWLISWNAPLIAFAWVIVGEMALGSMAFFLAGRRSGLRMPVSAAQFATMRALITEAWPLMFASLAIVVYMKIDEVMLRQLAGPTAVGIYAAAVKLSELWYFLPIALASSVLPALLRARQQDPAGYAVRQQQYYDLSAAVAYGLSVPITLLAPWIVSLAYGPQFADAGPILVVHIWASIFVFLGVARGQWLVNEGLQKFYLAATCAGAVANVALNLVFIPRWGGLGAAWATVASYGLAAWLASYFHPGVRATGAMQTRALLIPFLGWRYLQRS